MVKASASLGPQPLECVQLLSQYVQQLAKLRVLLPQDSIQCGPRHLRLGRRHGLLRVKPPDAGANSAAIAGGRRDESRMALSSGRGNRRTKSCTRLRQQQVISRFKSHPPPQQVNLVVRQEVVTSAGSLLSPKALTYSAPKLANISGRGTATDQAGTTLTHIRCVEAREQRLAAAECNDDVQAAQVRVPIAQERLTVQP